MDIFIKASKFLNNNFEFDEMRKILNGAIIRIEKNYSGHDYGDIGEIMRIAIVNETGINSGKKGCVTFGRIKKSNGELGNNIDSEEFSIAIDIPESINAARKSIEYRIKKLKESLTILNSFTEYLEAYGLERLNIEHFLSNKITNILEDEKEITTRTQKLVDLCKQNISM